MPPEGPQESLVREWLAHAVRDLAAGERLLAPPAFPAEAAFHAQQAIAKALKGLLAWHNLPFARTHDLDAVLEQCASLVPEVLAFRHAVAPLTRYGVETRYPGAEPMPSEEEAQAALELAHTVVAFVRDHLPPAAWP